MRSTKLNYWGKNQEVAKRENHETGLTKYACNRNHKHDMCSTSEVVGRGQVDDERHECNELEKTLSWFNYRQNSKPYNSNSSRHVDPKKINERDMKINLLKLFRREYSLLRKSKGGRPSKRIDLQVYNDLKQRGLLPECPRTFGKIPGVNIQDEFEGRIELMIVGLHSHPIRGIDYARSLDDQLLATCIVATDGYFDTTSSSSNDITYTGEGGTFEVNGKSKNIKNQELKRGNLALKNSIEAKNDVRVIRGVKPNFGCMNSKGGTQKTIFVYDGLYKVTNCIETMGPFDKSVFKFVLERCPGQKIVKWQKYKC